MERQLAKRHSCGAAELTLRYVDSLIGWWLPGATAPAPAADDFERDAKRRWEEEGGSWSA
jgi:hypothetical protein